MQTARSQLISILLHVAGILLLLSITARLSAPPRQRAPAPRPVRLIAPRYMRMLQAADHPAGGGDRSQSPAQRGRLPEPAPKTFIYPAVRTVPDPNLPVLSTIQLDAPVLNIPAAQIGDPLGVLGAKGSGPGGPGGIGGGCCGGAGDRNGFGGVDARFVRPTTPPVLIYKVEPEFSEEARKAKYQGSVLLEAEIGINGLPSNIRVVRGPGMGLDGKALEAVARWRFRPALRDGKPVIISALIEVNFHLL